MPVSEIGLMPMPESGAIRFPISLAMNSMTRSACGVPLAHSMPAYTSSVFSRKMTTFISSGWVTGAGVPAKYRTGRMQAYRSSTWRSVTFRLRIPPPTGVVSGPLMATL